MNVKPLLTIGLRGTGMLKINWKNFSLAIRAQAVIDAEHISNACIRIGISHARMVNAAQGRPVGTEIFLTLCHWMQQDPFSFTERTTHD